MAEGDMAKATAATWGSDEARALGALSSEGRLHEMEAVRAKIQPKPHPVGLKQLTVDFRGKTLPIYHYPSQTAPSNQRVFTFLVLGETGTGKTTLLDAFVNCLSAQGFSDTWRWKLVDESAQKKHAGQSQTSHVTCYYVWDERDVDRKCHIRIIDTPGFGDT